MLHKNPQLHNCLLLIVLVFPFLLLLSNCNTPGLELAENNIIQSATIDNTNKITVSPPTISPPTVSPMVPANAISTIVTVSPAQEINLAKALQSENCELPCYIGITPGKTTWAEAQQILFDLGAGFDGEYYEEGLRGYSYDLIIGSNPSSNNTPLPQLGIYQHLIFTIDDLAVQRISVSLHTFDQVSKFHKYWSRYSPQQIFIRLGNPSTVHFGKIRSAKDGSHMALVYESLGIVMEFHGIGEGSPVCPNFEANGYTSRKFILTNLSSKLGLYPLYYENVSPANHDMWLSVPEMFGISQDELYDRIVLDPSTCFDIK